MTYIYGLVDPRDNIIRYVGKSDNPKIRLKQHLNNKENSGNYKKHLWLKSLFENELKPKVVILEECSDWSNAEKYWIKFLRNQLVNIHQGGQEPPRYCGEEHWTYRLKKEDHPRFGHKCKEITKKKISKANGGENNGMYGKRYRKTPEQIEKTRQANLGRKFTDEHRKNLSESHKGYVMPDSQKEKIGNALRGRKRSKDVCRKISIGLMGKPLSSEHKEKLSRAKMGSKNPNYDKKWSDDRKKLCGLSHKMSRSQDIEKVKKLNEEYKKIKGVYNKKYAYGVVK